MTRHITAQVGRYFSSPGFRHIPLSVCWRCSLLFIRTLAKEQTIPVGRETRLWQTIWLEFPKSSKARTNTSKEFQRVSGGIRPYIKDLEFGAPAIRVQASNDPKNNEDKIQSAIRRVLFFFFSIFYLFSWFIWCFCWCAAWLFSPVLIHCTVAIFGDLHQRWGGVDLATNCVLGDFRSWIFSLC